MQRYESVKSSSKINAKCRISWNKWKVCQKGKKTEHKIERRTIERVTSQIKTQKVAKCNGNTPCVTHVKGTHTGKNGNFDFRF
jgi:hypothetical protein